MTKEVNAAIANEELGIEGAISIAIVEAIIRRIETIDILSFRQDSPFEFSVQLITEDMFHLWALFDATRYRP